MGRDCVHLLSLTRDLSGMNLYRSRICCQSLISYMCVLFVQGRPMLRSNWLTDSMAPWLLCAFLVWFVILVGWLSFLESWEVLEEVEVEKEYNEDEE